MYGDVSGADAVRAALEEDTGLAPKDALAAKKVL
jgi:hypothetical protein